MDMPLEPQVYVSVNSLVCEWDLEPCDRKADWVTALDTGLRIFLCNHHAQAKAELVKP